MNRNNNRLFNATEEEMQEVEQMFTFNPDNQIKGADENEPNAYATRLCIAGVAGSGKDYLFEVVKRLLSKYGYEAQRFSLADVLKQETREEILDKHGVDVLNCTREEKDIVRPDLVASGKKRRQETNGRYFIDILLPQVIASSADLSCVTDIRYDEYERDELYFAKIELNALLVHVELIKDGKVVGPANEDEEKFDPILKEASDYCFVWKHKKEFKGGENDPEYIKHVEDEVTNVLNELGYGFNIPIDKE